MSGCPPRLVFATTNRGKLREVAEILAPDGVTVVGVGTSSRAYSTTGGLGAGSDRTRIPRQAVRSRCKAAMRTSRGSVVAYWGGAGSKVAWVELLRRPYGGC